MTVAEPIITKKPSAILAKAADIIEENGWHRRGYSDNHAVDRPDSRRPVCALGAISLAEGNVTYAFAANSNRDDWEPAIALWEHLGNRAVGEFDVDDLAEDVINGVGRWNDADDQTAGNVVEALRACATDLAKAGR